MVITIYELMGLIKDDKAPKKIKIDDDVWYFVKRDDGNYYIDKEEYCFHCCQLGFEYYIKNNKLNDTVEILPEENDEQKNFVDLGFKDNEPIGFKFDTSINKPVLARRCDNHYYAYPSLIGWVYYRSRYLGDKDKEIIDMNFDEWAYKVLETLEQEFKEKNKNDEWEDIEEINVTKENCKRFIEYDSETGHHKYTIRLLDEYFSNKINQLISNQKYLKERLNKDESIL